MKNIQAHQIWQVVTDSFYSSGKEGTHHVGNSPRRALVNLKRDEFIEIRYPFEWHFRTADDLYLHAHPKEILRHCRFIGNIDEKIWRKNQHSLKQILEQKLYKPIWEDDVNA